MSLILVAGEAHFMDEPAMEDSSNELSAAELELFKAVARRMRAARMKEGLTHAALAERIGVKTSYIFTLERGTANPTLKTLHRVATALKLDPAELLPGSAHPEIQSADLERIRQLCEGVESLLSEWRHDQEEVLKKESNAAGILQEALAGLRTLERRAISAPAAGTAGPGLAEGDRQGQQDNP